MTLLTLRPYQTEAIDAVEQSWQDSDDPIALVMATGLGKTVVMAEIVRRALDQGRRPMVLVHRDELVRQTEDKLGALCDGASIGVVKAERHELHADAVVASVQTISRRLDSIPTDRFTMTLVDECHHAAARTYRETIDRFEAGRTLGVTATLSRGDGQGLGDVFARTVFERDILFGIMNGYLADIRPCRVVVEGLDLSRVRRSGGDYQDGALGEAMQHAEAGKVIARAYREHATLPDGTLRKGIAFWPTVEAARQFADDFNAVGVPTEVITGDTPTGERQAIYARVRSGETLVLSSCMVLTEGFDMPEISCVVMGRPTNHAGLYIQMAGRGLRPFPGKRDCLLMDVSGVTSKHTLISISDLSGSGDDRVEVRDDETLSGAVERAVAEREGRKLTGKARLEQVDRASLFGASMSAWLRTHAGTWFVPTRRGLFFLAPDPSGGERWMVGKTATEYAKRGSAGQRRIVNHPSPVRPTEWGWIRSGLPLDYAMAAAEQWAAELDPTVSQRKASWRTRKAVPTDAQRDLAARYRIDTTGMNKSQLSDAISVEVGSRTLDPRV